MVSVIVTTKNESSHIASCLQSIKNQLYQDIEVIVVDNGSNDKTKVIAKTFGARVFDKGPERSAQRNFGAQNAKGGYLLFLDADMELMPSVVQECLEEIQKPRDEGKKLIGLVIPEKSIGIGYWAHCKALERSFYEGVEWMEAARFYKKEAFVSIGGYDVHLTGPEDFELPQRLKMRYGTNKIGRISSYILHNEGKISLRKLLQKKYYYGRKMGHYRSMQTSQGYFDKQANLFLRYGIFLKRPLRLLRDPVHAIGMFVMKTLEIGALAYGGLRG